MGNQLSQKYAMIKRWVRMATGVSQVGAQQGRGKLYEKDRICGYYNDLTGKISPNTLLDESGIPLSLISGNRKRYFPIAIAQYALAQYDLFLASPAANHIDVFFTSADWILGNQREDGSWNAFGPIESSKYTVSSMAQGECSSVLLRAFVQTEDERYLRAAKSSIDFMLTPVESGGTSVYVGNSLFLEEYPQQPRISVLNGWIFSLFGLYDLGLIHEKYRSTFERSALTLSRELGRYDSGYWSYYDLRKRVSSPAYHDLHIALLEALYDLTAIECFATKAQEFEGYKGNGINTAKAIGIKIIQKIGEKSDAVLIQ